MLDVLRKMLADAVLFVPTLGYLGMVNVHKGHLSLAFVWHLSSFGQQKTPPRLLSCGAYQFTDSAQIFLVKCSFTVSILCAAIIPSIEPQPCDLTARTDCKNAISSVSSSMMTGIEMIIDPIHLQVKQASSFLPHLEHFISCEHSG